MDLGVICSNCHINEYMIYQNETDPTRIKRQSRSS
jgi:hypothetical protein